MKKDTHDDTWRINLLVDGAMREDVEVCVCVCVCVCVRPCVVLGAAMPALAALTAGTSPRCITPPSPSPSPSPKAWPSHPLLDDRLLVLCERSMLQGLKQVLCPATHEEAFMPTGLVCQSPPPIERDVLTSNPVSSQRLYIIQHQHPAHSRLQPPPDLPVRANLVRLVHEHLTQAALLDHFPVVFSIITTPVCRHRLPHKLALS
jgi:hypothetical protein